MWKYNAKPSDEGWPRPTGEATAAKQEAQDDCFWSCLTGGPPQKLAPLEQRSAGTSIAVRAEHYRRHISYVLRNKGHASLVELGANSTFWGNFIDLLRNRQAKGGVGWLNAIRTLGSVIESSRFEIKAFGPNFVQLDLVFKENSAFTETLRAAKARCPDPRTSLIASVGDGEWTSWRLEGVTMPLIILVT